MPSEKSLLCSAHFISDFFTQSDSSKRQLKKEAIPTIFPSYPSYLQISIPKKRRELKRKIVDETKNEELLKLAADLHHLPQNFWVLFAQLCLKSFQSCTLSVFRS